MTEDTAVLPLPHEPAPKPRRTGVIATAIAVPAVLLIGGGAYAYQQLNGGGAQPDDVLPASVVAYARLDADPSASQKIKLFKLIKKSPDLAKEIGIKTDKQDLRKDIAEEILGSTCPNVDYDKDIKPWLGDRIGAAATSDASLLVAIQVTDEKAARKGIELVTGCQNLTAPGIAFSKGYALVGESQKVVDAAMKSATKKPLADDPAFTEDMESLGDEGIASVWVDAEKATKAFGSEMGFTGPGAGNPFADARSAALALRAGDDNVELIGIGHRLTDIGKPATVNLGELPARSVLAASFSGGGKIIGDQWDEFLDGIVTGFNSGSGLHITRDDVDATIKDIEHNTDLVLPRDLKTLLGDNITFVIGDTNLDSIDSIEGPDDLAKLDVAIAMQSDSKSTTDLARRIAKSLADFTGIELAVESTKDGAVLATNKTFAKTFESGKNLSDSDSYASVIDADDSVGGGFFFDIAKVIDVARGMDLSAQDKKDLDQLKELKAFGFSTTKDGDRVIRGTLKLSFN